MVCWSCNVFRHQLNDLHGLSLSGNHFPHPYLLYFFILQQKSVCLILCLWFKSTANRQPIDCRKIEGIPEHEGRAFCDRQPLILPVNIYSMALTSNEIFRRRFHPKSLKHKEDLNIQGKKFKVQKIYIQAYCLGAVELY